MTYRVIGEIGPRTDAEVMTEQAWENALNALTPAERIAWAKAYEALAALRDVSRTVQSAEAIDHALS